MAKLDLRKLADLEDKASAVNNINLNSEDIENAIENTLSRDGSTPNHMLADLDMNSRRILNLPAPTSPTEPLRKDDQFTAEEAQGFAQAAADSADEALAQADRAESEADRAASTALSVDNIADLRFLDGTLTVDDRVRISVGGYYDVGDGGGGAFYYDASDTTTSDNGGTVIVDALDRRWKRPHTKGEVNALWFGATFDGMTDDAASIQAAIDYVSITSGRVLCPAGVAIVGSQLNIETSGVSLEGVTAVAAPGHPDACELRGSAVSGAVVRCWVRSTGVKNIRITSTDDRYAATTTTGHGLHFEPVDEVSADSMSRCFAHNVTIEAQPTDGLHQAAFFEFGELRDVTIADCKRHGVVMGDGTVGGRTNKNSAPFVFKLTRVRAFECGGTGIAIGELTQTSPSRNLVAEHVEALGCAWDSTARLTDDQIFSNAGNQIWINPDVEDQQFDQTVTSSLGKTRTAKGTPSRGMQLLGGNIRVLTPYFSSLTRSITIPSGSRAVVIDSPIVFAGEYGVNQAEAFNVANAVNGLSITVNSSDTSGADSIIGIAPNGSDIRIDNDRYIGLSTSVGNFLVNSAGLDATITSAVLDLRADKVLIRGEEDTTDSVSTFRFASGVNGFDLQTVRIINRHAYTITVTHGTGNIRTKSGSNLSLTQNVGATFTYNSNNNVWIEV